MELTRKQKLLINGLQLLKMNERTIEVVMLACQKEMQTTEMLAYIVEIYEKNHHVTEQDLMKKIAEMEE